ncbi:hypothetical protein FJ651_14710 [Paucihalobacter ruber]|uniref:OmpA-like domain-containing protein n=1 Tax=Paucihalobacter ruber TaxID=2567861 RepID=A0A506PEH4_9FLAO|nr:hypothetical protein [Paucihalobacter ruber]TPV31442.1 hypothetical protein FJ651_14710 [Paucihalobacter ruber]
MDGSKKLIGIFLLGYMILTFNACKVQKHSYGGLYIDSENLVSDSIRADKKIVDFEIKTDSIKKMMRKSTDSLYQKRVEKLLTSLSDSIEQLRFQISEIQKQQYTITDSIYVWGEQQDFQPKDSVQKVESFKTPAQIKTDNLKSQQTHKNELKTTNSVKNDTAENRKKMQIVKKADNQSEIKSDQVIEDRNDSINSSKTQNGVVTKSLNQKLNTTDNAIETKNINKEDALMPYNNNTQVLQTKNDTIVPILSQIDELQSTNTIKNDTIFMVREIAESTLLENQHQDYMNRQKLKAKDDQIQSLQNQINAQQSSNTKRQQQSFILRDRTQRQPSNNQQSDQLSMQLIKDRNDTIQYLRSQLRSLQLEPQKRDTVILEQQNRNSQSVNKPVDASKLTYSVKNLEDSLKSLNSRMSIMEKSAAARQNERNAALSKKPDTSSMVVFYDKGNIVPNNEALVLKQIKTLSNNNKVLNLTLSGYTDSSGSSIVNKKITNERINYLSEIIKQWISEDKIFFQNFGDVLSSNKMISDERRIEITVLTEEPN